MLRLEQRRFSPAGDRSGVNQRAFKRPLSIAVTYHLLFEVRGVSPQIVESMIREVSAEASAVSRIGLVGTTGVACRECDLTVGGVEDGPVTRRSLRQLLVRDAYRQTDVCQIALFALRRGRTNPLCH